MKFKIYLSPLFYTLLIFNIASINAQQTSPYSLAWKYDGPAIGVGVSFAVCNQLLWNPKIAGMTEAQVLALNANDLWAIDRFATQNYSKTAQKASDGLAIGSVCTPALLLFDKDVRRDYQTVSVMYAETMLLNYMAMTMTKELVLRPRPFTYNPNVPLADRMEQDARFSFFSGHTSTVAASSFFAAKVYNDYHPHNPETPWIWAAAAALPAATALLRVEGGKHFPTDVLVGYLVGAGIGILMPELHKINR